MSKGDNKSKHHAFAVWRKNLCHINKTRDNHFSRLGGYFDLTLLVRHSADIGEHIQEYGTKVIPVHITLRGVVGYLEFYAKVFKYFWVNHRKQPYDFILSPIGEEPIGWLLKFFAIPKVRLVYDLWDVPGLAVARSSSFIKEIARGIYQWMLPKIIRRGDCIIAGVLVAGLRNYLLPGQKVIQAENGVLLERFSTKGLVPDNAFWPERRGGIRLVYAGYVHPSRGSSEMIRLVYELSKLNIQVDLMLIGPSDPKAIDEIERLCNTLGVEDSVIVTGEIPSSRIPSILLAADMCMCPLEDIEKFRWSFPVKVYEYLAMGKSVVATDTPGIRSLIKDRFNGFIYKSGDMAGLIDIVVDLSTSQVLLEQVSNNAKNSIKNKGWDRVVGKVAIDLNDCLKTDSNPVHR